MIHISAEAGKKLLDLHAEVGQFFYFRLDNLKIISRPLFVSELDTIQAMEEAISQDIIHDWVCEKCIVYASCGLEALLSTEKAGYAACIAGAIMLKSNMKNDDKLLEILDKKRQEASQLMNQIEHFISSAFKISDLRSIRNTTTDKYIGLLARAETLVGKQALTMNRAGRRKARNQVPVQEGYNSIDIQSMLSEDNVDKVTSESIERDLREWV
jgi:hypothetical protein